MSINKGYYTYVLFSEKDGNIYIGITNDLKRRIEQHNKGKNHSTKYRIPLKLIHKEKHRNRIEARKREKFLKSGCGREWIKDRFLRR